MLSFTNFYDSYANRTFTFTNNNGTYEITAANAPALKKVTQSGDKLIVIFGGSNTDDDVTITLDKSDNSYSVSNPEDYYAVHDLTAVVVNGTDIKSQLTKK